jgi:hypothetical protein
VYRDSASATGKSAILKFSSNLSNAITIRNFNEDAAKASQGYMGIKIDPKQNVLVKGSDYQTEPNPFQPWDFDPNTFAAGADSAMYERNGKTFVVYLQQGAAAASKLVLNIAGAVGAQQDDVPLTPNSIALCARSITAKCTKRLKNRTKTSQTAKDRKKSKRNRPLAGIEAAQSAIEFAVTGIESHQGAVHA